MLNDVCTSQSGQIIGSTNLYNRESLEQHGQLLGFGLNMRKLKKTTAFLS